MSNNQDKIMYHVVAKIQSALGPDKQLNRQMDKHDLENFIGRYTMNYGPPLDVSHGTSSGVMEYEFARTEQTTVGLSETIINLKFWRVLNNRSELPVVPPAPKKEAVKHPEQIQSLIDDGILTECYGYNNRWDY